MGFLGWFPKVKLSAVLLRLAPKLLVLFCASAHLCASWPNTLEELYTPQKFATWNLNDHRKTLKSGKKSSEPSTTSMTFWGSSNSCWFSICAKRVVYIWILFLEAWKEHSKGLKSQSRWKRFRFPSFPTTPSAWKFVVPKSWLYAGSFQGSGRRCVGGLNCLLLKCIHIFCILGKFRMYPRRITIFFFGGGGFIPFLFFNLQFPLPSPLHQGETHVTGTWPVMR